MQSQFVKSRRPNPFWQVLAVVGAYCTSKKLEPGNLDPEKMTLTRKVVLVPGEGGTQSWTRHTCNYSGLEAYNKCLKRPAQNFQDVGPNTLAILEAYNRCLKKPGKNFQYLGAR